MQFINTELRAPKCINGDHHTPVTQSTLLTRSWEFWKIRMIPKELIGQPAYVGGTLESILNSLSSYRLFLIICIHLT